MLKSSNKSDRMSDKLRSFRLSAQNWALGYECRMQCSKALISEEGKKTYLCLKGGEIMKIMKTSHTRLPHQRKCECRSQHISSTHPAIFLSDSPQKKRKTTFTAALCFLRHNESSWFWLFFRKTKYRKESKKEVTKPRSFFAPFSSEHLHSGCKNK